MRKRVIVPFVLALACGRTIQTSDAMPVCSTATALKPTAVCQAVWNARSGSSMNLGPLATNAFGETVVTGIFQGSVDIGPQHLESPPQSAVGFAAMFDATCNFDWVLPVPNPVSSLAALPNHRFVIGYQNGASMVLSVLDVNGAVVWSNAFLGNLSDPPLVRVGPDGNIYALVPQFSGNVTFDGGSASSSNQLAALLVQFDPNGALLFDVVLGTDDILDYSVARDVWITGNMGASIAVGSDVFQPPNHLSGPLGNPQTQGYLMRLSTSDGRLIGGTSFAAAPYRVASDPCSQHATVLVENVTGSVDFGLGPMSAPICALQFDSSGYPIWNQPMDGLVALDGAGNIIDIVSQPWETVDNVVVPGSAFLTSYDALGNERFSIAWKLSSSTNLDGPTFSGPTVGGDGAIGVVGIAGNGASVDLGLGPIANAADAGLWEVTGFFARFR